LLERVREYRFWLCDWGLFVAKNAVLRIAEQVVESVVLLLGELFLLQLLELPLLVQFFLLFLPEESALPAHLLLLEFDLPFDLVHLLVVQRIREFPDCCLELVLPQGPMSV